MKHSFIDISASQIIILIVLLVLPKGTLAQTCEDMAAAGSVDFITEESAVPKNTTYVVLAYRIPCDGVVVSWEFCYQLRQNMNTGNASVTFYPSVWRFISGSYKLIHSGKVTFVPQVMSGLLHVMCNKYKLRINERFIVLTNDTVGLYSGDNASQILTNIRSNSSSTITYSMQGNQSNISCNAATVEYFNIAIEAQISNIQVTASSMSSSMGTPTTSVVSFTSIIDSISTNTSSTTGVTVITRLSISNTTDGTLDTTRHTVSTSSPLIITNTITSNDINVTPVLSTKLIPITSVQQADQNSTSLTISVVNSHKSPVPSIYILSTSIPLFISISSPLAPASVASIPLMSTLNQPTFSPLASVSIPSTVISLSSISSPSIPLTSISLSTTSTSIPSTSTPSTSTRPTYIPSISFSTSSFLSVVSSVSATSTTSGSSSTTNSVVIGVIVGICITMLVAILILVFLIIVCKRKRIQPRSVSHPLINPASETDDSMIYMSQSLEGATIMTVHDTNHPTHEEATALNQKDAKGNYETIEMFEQAKNNTNEQCKRISYYYYSTITADVNTTNNEMLHDTSLTDSASLIQSESSHTPADSYYNINSYTDTELKQQVSDGESDEPLFVDPGVEEDGIYNQLKSGRVSTFAPNDIKTYDALGSGQFGIVKLGTLSRHNESSDPVQVAVKTLNSRCSESDRVKFLREAAIMGQFVHNNVVQLHGVVTEEENMMIILEYMPKGDLQKFLLGLQSKIAPDIGHELLSFCRQIAAGLDYLSKKHFVHRDLAARNILLSDDYVCKIADFGMARDITDDNYYMSSKGKIPVKWTAPEALFYQRYSIQSDIWSYGCVLYEIWSIGHKPFEQFNTTQYLEKIMEGYRLPPPPGCSRAIYDIMIQCWHYEPKARIRSEAVVRMLSKSDRVLLQWSDEDKPFAAEAAMLGKPLHFGEQLYKDLQNVYTSSQLTS